MPEVMKALRITFPPPSPRSHGVHLMANIRQIAEKISGRYPNCGLFVVCDRNVYPLYGKRLTSELLARESPVRTFVLPAGENRKCISGKSALDDRLLAGGLRRDSVLIALGGGVIGDLAGYSAATLLRGVRLVQVPTTLLAQVDSSVGGKVGINHVLGKNLIGAFHQPDAVYIAPAVLRTLPQQQFLSGLGEVIKYGMILSHTLFRELESSRRVVLSRSHRTMGNIITRCIRLKATVVTADERESGTRRILNFGHTIGHAIETLSNHRVHHGYAVALGMVLEGGIAYQMGLLRSRDLDRLRNLVASYGFPTILPPTATPRRMLTAISRDKKNEGGSVRFTLVRGIGKAEAGFEVPPEILLRVLRG